MKTCTKCQQQKSETEFYVRSDTGKLHSWCKSCKHQSGADWNRRNKQRHSELNAQWYEENKEQHLSNSKTWYENNKARKLMTVTAREKRCIQATPSWVDKSKTLDFYTEAKRLTEKTGIPHEVDHIIPLNGKNVSGLNVPNNLQILTREENRRKANKY